MAKVAMGVKKWLGEDTAIVVTRFIGTTPDSSDARGLMRSICQQICRADKNSENETVPQDIRSLLAFFPTCLEKHASSSNPVVLVLDSLDQLSDDDGGRELDWVPKELPDNVYIILSTLPGTEYICFPSCR
ncbi:hypothetical protein OS493_011630 [Desmophyllum pertusum]|uniref:NACHT domain-containing protein n=1 Tax=Desmophyllum pertusum TaxID=174260 RepID=A0A9W9YQX4_9CNID|nr:hypothetical protein OS493_011630 [Desmophyllum pertusum]